MPNWCYTNMLVAGNKRELRKLISAMREPKQCYELNRLVPLDPRGSIEKVSTHKDKDGNDVTTTYSVFASVESDGFDGYADAIEKWGTKWGACNVEVDDENSYPLHVRFESAWSPATKLIQSVSEQFPNLVFSLSYDEEGHQFCGWEVIANGETVEEGSLDTDRMPEDLQKLYDEATEKDETILWDEYYEAHNDWRNNNTDMMYTDAETVMNEYLVWKRKADRQRKEGRYVESFIPSV